MNIGLDQIGIPAPAIYRRTVNALIIFFVPATGTLIFNMPADIISDRTKIIVGLIVTWVMAVLKGVEYIIGTEDKTQGAK